MQITQRFVVDYPRAAVWAYFGRLDDVTRCMPGASLTEPPVDNRAKFKLNVKLGPISAAFAGDCDVERDDADQRGLIRGNARDTRGDSRVKGAVDYRLAEEGAGAKTAVDIAVDFTLTGRLAQFSRAGIVNDLAARFTEDFAKNLAAALAAEAPAATTRAGPGSAPAGPGEPGTTPAAAQGSARPEVPRELDAGRLVFSVIWARIRGFFRSLFGRA
ncbi:MAG: SRPBCC family protein [Burkholderiales bacterium]|nr:SRPBCC family protein [Burkholderiales bacterium]